MEPDDLKWDAHAFLFNAITRHPAARSLLFSSRQAVLKRIWPKLEREIARQVRTIERRSRKWDRKYGRVEAYCGACAGPCRDESAALGEDADGT